MTPPRAALTLMYHQVGTAPDLYVLERAAFLRHVAAIRAAVGGAPVGRVDEPGTWRGDRPVFITFDDGHDSAYDVVADLFEAQGWRAHFFVVTDYIGRPGFLTARQIRELDRRGHAIGSHTCSHPVPISHCDDAQLGREWGESRRVLEEITGHAVTTASVPGGYFSRRVAHAAAEAGVRFLFTSEPRASVSFRDGCAILGRYAIRKSVTPETAAALAEGRLGPRLREAVLWNAKKVLKGANARAYIRVRRAILGY